MNSGDERSTRGASIQSRWDTSMSLAAPRGCSMRSSSPYTRGRRNREPSFPQRNAGLAREVVADGPEPNIGVDSFSGLTVDYARSQDAGVIVRGLRAVSGDQRRSRRADLRCRRLWFGRRCDQIVPQLIEKLQNHAANVAG